MHVVQIIPLTTDNYALKTPKHLGTILALDTDGCIWVGDIIRGKRIIEWVEYDQGDFTKRD